jgi:hypothetical protein
MRAFRTFVNKSVNKKSDNPVNKGLNTNTISIRGGFQQIAKKNKRFRPPERGHARIINSKINKLKRFGALYPSLRLKLNQPRYSKDGQ